MFEFGSLIKYAALGFVLHALRIVQEGFRLGFIPDKLGPVNPSRGGAGQGHGYDREAARSRLVPLSAIGDHRKRRNKHLQYLSVPMSFQTISDRFLHDFLQLFGYLRSYGTKEDA